MYTSTCSGDDLDGLKHLDARHYRIGGGDRRHYIARDALTVVVAQQRRDVEHVHAEVGRRAHEPHGPQVVLIEAQAAKKSTVSLRHRQLIQTQLTQDMYHQYTSTKAVNESNQEGGDAVLHVPHILFPALYTVRSHLAMLLKSNHQRSSPHLRHQLYRQ